VRRADSWSGSLFTRRLATTRPRSGCRERDPALVPFPRVLSERSYGLLRRERLSVMKKLDENNRYPPARGRFPRLSLFLFSPFRLAPTQWHTGSEGTTGSQPMYVVVLSFLFFFFLSLRSCSFDTASLILLQLEEGRTWATGIRRLAWRA